MVLDKKSQDLKMNISVANEYTNYQYTPKEVRMVSNVKQSKTVNTSKIKSNSSPQDYKHTLQRLMTGSGAEKREIISINDQKDKLSREESVQQILQRNKVIMGNIMRECNLQQLGIQIKETNWYIYINLF